VFHEKILMQNRRNHRYSRAVIRIHWNPDKRGCYADTRHNIANILRKLGFALIERNEMRQFTQAEKEKLYPVLAKVAEYLLERLAAREAHKPEAAAHQLSRSGLHGKTTDIHNRDQAARS
jgi:hypothetical protein